MPTVVKDQFYYIDPGNPPPRGTPLTVTRAQFTDQDDDGFIETGSVDTFNGELITDVWVGDTVTIRLADNTRITYTGVTYYLESGAAVFTPTDGQVLQEGTLFRANGVNTATQVAVDQFGPTCFTPGTLIDTPSGLKRIETLRTGDLVLTLDDGPQPIRYIADETFDASAEHAPIRFAKGAIGNDRPLLVSPQHRMLISGWQAELFYGQEEVLVAAKHLVNGTTVTRETGKTVRYIHLLFARHQIIWGGGVPSESFYPHAALHTVEGRLRSALLLKFPDLRGFDEASDFVRPVLRRQEAALLAA